MVHVKMPLLPIGKSSPCGGSGLPLSLYEWCFTVCMTLYNRKWNVLSASLNKNISFFPSFKKITSHIYRGLSVSFSSIVGLARWTLTMWPCAFRIVTWYVCMNVNASSSSQSSPSSSSSSVLYVYQWLLVYGKSVCSWCGRLHGVDPWAISRSSQCTTTGVTKAVVCAILSVGWCI